jgi:hypothetical protein
MGQRHRRIRLPWLAALVAAALLAPACDPWAVQARAVDAAASADAAAALPQTWRITGEALLAKVRDVCVSICVSERHSAGQLVAAAACPNAQA